MARERRSRTGGSARARGRRRTQSRRCDLDGVAPPGLRGRVGRDAASEALDRGSRGGAPHVIVLDVMLPDMDGFEVAQAAVGRTTPTCRSCSSALATPPRTRSRGLTIGGDDYVTKPFSLEELIARLRNILRRTGSDSASSRPPASSPISSSTTTRSRSPGPARPIELTGDRVPAAALPDAQRPPRAHSKAQLLDHVWELRLRRRRAACSRPTSATCARRSTRTDRRCCTPFAVSVTRCGFPGSEPLSLRARLLIGLRRTGRGRAWP